MSGYCGVDLEEMVRAFVQGHGAMKQRDAEWYASMGKTIGGSEMAAILGLNPYSTFYDVVLSKAVALGGGSRWDAGSEACWWGVLFEDIICAFVALDLGGDIEGAEICIREIAGHRNSPDGFIVASFYYSDDGALCLWTTDMDPALAAVRNVLLLEFKCPISRKPTLAVPKHYKPQLWSGLMVAPIAHQGLFVDAVFRKCGIADLGDSPDYDTEYHFRDRGHPLWGYPVAWGLVAVYAPLLDAPRHVRYGWRGPEWAPGDPVSDGLDADAALAAWEVHSLYFGLRLKAQGQTRDLADLGDMGAPLFRRALGLINQKKFLTRATGPCFADGRGLDLHSGAAVGAAVHGLTASPPEHYWTLGLLPWKLFEVDYVFVSRRPGFAEEVLPLMDNVHRLAAEAASSGDPAAYLNRVRPPPPAGKSSIICEADILDLFETIT